MMGLKIVIFDGILLFWPSNCWVQAGRLPGLFDVLLQLLFAKNRNYTVSYCRSFLKS